MPDSVPIVGEAVALANAPGTRTTAGAGCSSPHVRAASQSGGHSLLHVCSQAACLSTFSCTASMQKV